MLYRQRPQILRLGIGLEAETLISNSGVDAYRIACRRMETSIDTRDTLHGSALGLIRSVFPPAKGVRLVGVTISNFRVREAGEGSELPFREA
jgi:hypothetical protein